VPMLFNFAYSSHSLGAYLVHTFLVIALTWWSFAQVEA